MTHTEHIHDVQIDPEFHPQLREQCPECVQRNDESGEKDRQIAKLEQENETLFITGKNLLAKLQEIRDGSHTT